MKKEKLTIFDLCVQITGSFEGTGYGTVGDNFDGQGLSLGLLQWNIGQGTLQSYILNHINFMSYNYFPAPIRPLQTLSKEDAVKWCQDNFYDITGAFKHEWLQAWKRFVTDPLVINLQKRAIDVYFHQAKVLCGRLGFSHEDRRVMAFCFDVAVQNWSLDIQLPPDNYEQCYNILTSYDEKNMNLWIHEHLEPKQRQLVILAHLRALKAKKEWQQSVFTRKATIAIGIGYVNRTLYKLNKLF